MISDQQRREVAARMRNQIRYMCDNRKFYEYDLDVVECGNRTYRNIAASVEEYGNQPQGNYIHICETLADLIELPTCSIKREVRSGYPTTWGVCSRCGALVNAERAVSTATEYLPTRCCPNCGAEVVNDA